MTMQERNDGFVQEVLSGVSRLIGADRLMEVSDDEDTLAAVHEIIKSVSRDLSDAIDAFEAVQPDAV